MSNSAWDDQRIFLTVLETGSLAAAARKLGLSHPTVRNRIEVLEEELGVRLFTRSVNGLAPTDTARALLEPARAMELASQRFWRMAVSPPGEVAGVVRLSTSEIMGTEIVPTILAHLLELHPELRVELSVSNSPANVLAQEVDVALRNFAPQQGSLVARKLSLIPLGFFASVEYLARRGYPKHPSDLASHDLIGPDRSASDLRIVDRLKEKMGVGFPSNGFALRTDNHPAQLSAARAGVGIAVVQLPIGEADARLRRVLPELIVGTLETWVLTHRNLRDVPRVKAVMDMLAKSFPRHPK